MLQPNDDTASTTTTTPTGMMLLAFRIERTRHMIARIETTAFVAKNPGVGPGIARGARALMKPLLGSGIERTNGGCTCTIVINRPADRHLYK